MLQMLNVAPLELVYDLLSLHSSYDAYKRYSSHVPDNAANKSHSGHTIYNHDQLFFITYAQSRCEVNRPSVWMDNHLSWSYRLNISLLNFPQFAQTFSCSKSNHERCSILD